MQQKINSSLFILRLFLGLRLLYGVVDNIISWERMLEFATFLKAFGFPSPLLMAVVSVYAQAIAAVMMLLGIKVRIAAGLMVVNFLVALIMVHRNDTVESMTPALSMFVISLSLVLMGGGKYSLNKTS